MLTPSITLRLISDPAELGLERTSDDHYIDADGTRHVWRDGLGGWNWEVDRFGKGLCPALPLALTMLAFHSPAHRDLTALGEEPSTV